MPNLKTLKLENVKAADLPAALRQVLADPNRILNVTIESRESDHHDLWKKASTKQLEEAYADLDSAYDKL